jgi:hypothetical protein
MKDPDLPGEALEEVVSEEVLVVGWPVLRHGRQQLRGLPAVEGLHVDDVVHHLVLRQGVGGDQRLPEEPEAVLSRLRLHNVAGLVHVGLREGA